MLFELTPQQRLMLLQARNECLDVVIDTDTFNEVDDQFAVAYALLSRPKLKVEAVYAAPFFNDRVISPSDGVDKSREEAQRLLGRLGDYGRVPIFDGSRQYMQAPLEPVDSPAARDIIRRARAHTPENPLYVVGIAAATDIASALLLDPEIMKTTVIVWLGGNPTYWPQAREFNLSGDIYAAQVLFDSGCALVHIPAMTVSSHLLTTLAELKKELSGKNPLCDMLTERFEAYSENHFAWSKEIWDIAAIARLICPDWVPAFLMHSPILTREHTFSLDNTRHFILSAAFVYRNPVFYDMFTKLSSL